MPYNVILMKKDKLLQAVILLISINVATSCSVNKKYNDLLQTSKSETELLSNLKDFEINNPKHFESKLLLADYYLENNEPETALEYLKRAEVVKKHANRENRNENYSKLYAKQALIYFDAKDFDLAEQKCLEAIKYDKNKRLGYEYLLSHIYIEKQKNEEALSIIEKVYELHPELAGVKDLQAYMYLLAENSKYEKCAEILDLYLKTGKWFTGLGTFASNVYEKLGKNEESFLCAFLEYDYYSSMFQADDERFLENLSKIEKLFKDNGNFNSIEPAFYYVKNLYTSNEDLTNLSLSQNFISNYLIIRNKINNKTVSNNDFSELILLEPYYSSFPVYYWYVWECVKNIDRAQLKNYISVLKKVIALNPSSPYAIKAREEISKEFGDLKLDEVDLDLLLF